jgi:hypothetical protein
MRSLDISAMLNASLIFAKRISSLQIMARFAHNVMRQRPRVSAVRPRRGVLGALVIRHTSHSPQEGLPGFAGFPLGRQSFPGYPATIHGYHTATDFSRPRLLHEQEFATHLSKANNKNPAVAGFRRDLTACVNRLTVPTH